jgi:hypothetical protein
MAKKESYSAKDIFVLEGLDPVGEDRACILVQLDHKDYTI